MSKDFDLVAFRDFCAGKPAGEIYPLEKTVCALAQFGHPGLSIGNAAENGVPKRVYEATVYGRPHTFSALASRLSNLIGEGGNG